MKQHQQQKHIICTTNYTFEDLSFSFTERVEVNQIEQMLNKLATAVEHTHIKKGWTTLNYLHS